MTVNTTTDRALFDGTGAQSVFPYTFPILQESDMQVRLIDADGVETVLTQDTNYTITGAGTDVGGNVNMIVAPAADEQLLLIRAIAYTQPTDFKNEGRFYPRTHERSFDRAAMQIQRLAAGLALALRFPDTTEDFDSELPVPTANYVLAVNSAGTGFTLVSRAEVASQAGLYCLMQTDGSQAIPDATNTLVNWNTAAVVNSMSATVSATKIIVPTGVTKVRLSAAIAWSSNSTGARLLQVLKNGAGAAGLPAVNVPATGFSQNTVNSAVVTVVAGDAFSVRVNQSSGGSLSLVPGPSVGVWFVMEVIG